MKSLKDHVLEREMRSSGGRPESASFHSRSYHKYYEGYSEHKVTDNNGRNHIERVYTGVVHRADVSDAKLLRIKVSYLSFFLLTAVLFFAAASRPASYNTARYVTAAQAFTTAGLLYMAYVLLIYLTAKRDMTLYEFSNHKKLMKAAGCLTITLLACAVLTFLWFFINKSANIGQVCFSGLLELTGSACMFAMLKTEQNIVYSGFLSSDAPPEDANQIEA